MILTSRPFEVKPPEGTLFRAKDPNPCGQALCCVKSSSKIMLAAWARTAPHVVALKPRSAQRVRHFAFLNIVFLISSKNICINHVHEEMLLSFPSTRRRTKGLHTIADLFFSVEQNIQESWQHSFSSFQR